MLEKSFGLFYYLKPAKNQKGKKYIYLRITVNGNYRDRRNIICEKLIDKPRIGGELSFHGLGEIQ